jgi:hypothetical protein
MACDGWVMARLTLFAEHSSAEVRDDYQANRTCLMLGEALPRSLRQVDTLPESYRRRLDSAKWLVPKRAIFPVPERL